MSTFEYIVRVVATGVAFLGATVATAMLIGMAVPPLPPSPADGLQQEIDLWLPIHRAELCEVWSQNRQRVVDAMLVTDRNLHAGHVVAVVGQVCNA